MNIKEAGYRLGIFHGSIKHSVDPIQAERAEGVDAELESHFRKQAHKATMLAAHKVMCAAGMSTTKEARLVSALATVARDDSRFTKQASDLVFDAIKEVAFEKQAGIGGAAVGAAAALTTLGGAGVGGLYWKLKRDAEETTVKQKLKKQKVDYYNRLAQELRERMGTYS